MAAEISMDKTYIWKIKLDTAYAGSQTHYMLI